MVFFGKGLLASFLMFQMILPAVFAQAPAARAPAARAQDQTQEEETALEKARLLETVDRDYEQALRSYRLLSETQKKVALWARSELGAARCLLKLGRYDEAESVLQELIKPGLPEEVRDTSAEMLATVRRLNNSTRPGYASSVDNLVWQLLDAAAGTDEGRAKSARSELIKMGTLAMPVLKEMARAKDYFKSVTAFQLLKDIGGAEVFEFMRSCALDPDLALRKRCLDGMTKRTLPTELVPLIPHFLGGGERSLQIAAIRAFDSYCDWIDRIHGENSTSKETLENIAEILTEFCFNDDRELSDTAFSCLAAWVNVAASCFKDNFPVKDVAAVAERILEENWPRKDALLDEDQRLTWAMSIALCIGRDFAEKHLLELTIRYWPYKPSDTLRAASAMKPEGLGRIVNDTLSSQDPKKIDALDRHFKLNLFSDLPQGARERYLDHWAKSDFDHLGNTHNFLRKSWDVRSWAILLNGLLENSGDNDRRWALTALSKCPDPKNPECFEALLRWTSHPDLKTREYGLKVVSKLVESRTLDPGPDGVFRIVEGALDAESAEPELRRKPDGEFEFIPNSTYHAMNVLYNAARFGDREQVQKWLLEQKKAGLLDAITLYSPLIEELIKDDHDFTLTFWNRVGPLAKELLFRKIYDQIVDYISRSKNEWLIPLLKDWKLDRNWNRYSTELYITILINVYEPVLAPCVRETALALMENPELQTQNNLVWVRQLIERLSPHSDLVLEILPLWFQKIRPTEARVLDPFLSEVIQASSKNLTHALEWLAMDYDLSFKEKVIGNIFLAKRQSLKSRALFTSLDLNARLIQAWPDLDRDIGDKLLWNLVASDASITCGGFLLTLLTDPGTRADRRHLAYGALWRTGYSDAVQPLLEYLHKLAPGEETGPLKGTTDISADILMATERVFSDLEASSNRSSGGWLSNYTAEDRQRICLGILSEPVQRDWLIYRAADFVEVSNESEYAKVKEILEGDASLYVRGRLLEAMVGYLLRDRTPDKLRSREQLPEVPEAALGLLSNALDGRYDPESGGHAIYRTVELVGEYQVEALLDKVSAIAVSHPSSNLRLDAVECMENFRNPEMIPALIECLKDSRSNVRKKAKEILDRMREYEDQKRAWEAYLGEEGAKDKTKSPATALIEMLQREDPEVRLYAIKSLGKLGDPNTLPILVELVASGSDEEKTAAKAAIDAIAE